LALPVAAIVFPAAIPPFPQSWIEETIADPAHYGEADRNGHLAAAEQPDIWALRFEQAPEA